MPSNKYSTYVQLRYNYRLYPSPGQQQALARAFGCARVVFNDALAARRDAHQAGLPYPSDAELSARLTASKATPEREWLREVSAVVLQQALADLNLAHRNFLASLSGRRNGPKPGPVYVEDLCVAGLARTRLAACGTVHDRDVNAARNVLALGRRESQNAREGQVRPAPVLAPAGEAGSRRGAV